MKNRLGFALIALIAVFFKIYALEAIDAPSVFKNTPEMKKMRIITENLLYLSVMEEKETEENRKFVEKRKVFSKKIIENQYLEIKKELSLKKDFYNAIYEKAIKEKDNENKIAVYLIKSFNENKKISELLKNTPEMNKEEASYKFYDTYFGEIIKLDQIFEKTPSEVGVFDERELQGFDLYDGRIVLTFDDGPSKYTLSIIETLKTKKVPAIFFVLGQNIDKGNKNADKNVEILKKELEAGCDIGGHTMTHPNLIKIEDVEKVKYEISKVKTILKEKLNHTPKYFRASYGSRKQRELEIIFEEYDNHVLWNIDSQDWRKNFTPDIIAQRVIRLAYLYNGGIVLSHDINPRTPEALPKIIDELLKAGFKFEKL